MERAQFHLSPRCLLQVQDVRVSSWQEQPAEGISQVLSLSCTFQQDADQGSAVAVLGLLHQQLPIIQHPRYWVPPLNDPIHDVAGIVFLVGSKCL